MTGLYLVLLGAPVAQGRPRWRRQGGFVTAYDPPASRAYKAALAAQAKAQMGAQKPLTGPLVLSLRIYRPLLKGMSAKRAALAEAGALRPATRPDLDNYVKAVQDALTGICWADDAQIVAYGEPFGKFWSRTPRVEVGVEEWEKG